MGKGLGEVAQALAAVAGFLGVQAQMVGVAEHLFENQPGLIQGLRVVAAGPAHGLHQPESADVERAFVAHQPVRRGFQMVAIDQAVGHQPALFRGLVDGLQGFQHPRIGGGHKKDQGHHQVRGVQGLAAVILDESLAVFAPALFHNILKDFVPGLFPLGPVGRKRAGLGQPQGPIHGHPAHQLGIDEMLAPAAHFPNALVLLLPMLHHPVGQAAQMLPEVKGNGRAVLVVDIDRIQQLAVNVQLQLVIGPVANPHRAGAFVAIQMPQGFLGQLMAAVNAVHNLQGAVRIQLAGPFLDPVHKLGRLLGKANPQQGVQSKGGVPDPGIAVVPIPHPAQILRQAAGGGGDDGSGGFIGQQFQGESRALHHFPPAPLVSAAGQPVAPIGHGILEKLLAFRLGKGMGLAHIVADFIQGKGGGLPPMQGKVADQPAVLGFQRQGSGQLNA